MNKKLVIRQNGYKDCAVACLVSIMRYYNFYPSYEEVSYYLRVDKNGTNAYNIINGSKNYGFDGMAYKTTIEEIIDGKISLPVICHVVKNNMYHFIVLYKVNKKYFEIMDPSSNITKISLSDFKKIYLGTCINIHPIKIIKRPNYQKTLFIFIFDYLIENKKDITKTFILSLLIVILNMITNYFLTILIDSKYNYNLFLILMISFMSVAIFKSIFTIFRDKRLNDVENNIISKINIDINRKLFNLPYLFFKNKSTSEIESRLNDLSSFREITTSIILTTMIDIIFVLCSFIILFVINKTLLLISLIEILFYLLISSIFKHVFTRNIEEVQIYEEDYKKCLNESINAYETNRNINMLKSIIKKLEVKYLSFINKVKIFNNNKNKQNILHDITSDILYLILLFIEVKLLNENKLTIGSLILFNTIVYYFKEPLKNIIDFNQNIIYIKNVYKRINDLFVCDIKNNKIDDYVLSGNIEISNLSYSINGLNNIINNVSLKIDYKSKYLIYGSSGSGKSTLIKIILKYLEDYKGDIYINNINLKDISTSSIENSFTYVSQYNYLNSDTFKNNIVYDRDIKTEDYENIIHLCNLDSLRNSKSLRNDFFIEDNGFNISGGERQKIILARSLLKESNYIILDEALSEVSSEEEIDIINKIFKFFNEKTIIYISHRKEVIDMFDKKYKLERRMEV